MAFVSIVLLVIFAQNVHAVRVSVLFWNAEVSLALMLVGTAVLGFGGGVLSVTLHRRPRKRPPPEVAPRAAENGK